MKNNTIKKAVNKNLSKTQKLFAAAIDYDALAKALNDPKAAKELNAIFSKVRY